MIRATTPDDAVALTALSVAAGMFSEHETTVLDNMFVNYFGGHIDNGHVCLTDEEAGEPIGIAYYAPTSATDRTWELIMIGVRPDYQGRGHGMALLRYVEQTLKASDQRLLLIATSGLPSYTRTRRFYVKCGYEEEARIRDYYTTGEDMVMFRKVLNFG